jgi:type IV fimbrial biogenesis protein FimT
MVTLAVAGVLLAMAIPSFTSVIKNNRQTTLLNEFTSYFHYAKSQAVTRGISTTVCKRNPAGTDCGDSSASWDDGWIVFIDEDADGNLDDDGDTDLCEPDEDDDCVLKIHGAIDSDIGITSPSTAFTITPRGFTSAAATFTFCDSRGSSKAKAKMLSKTGRIETSTSSVTCS